MLLVLAVPQFHFIDDFLQQRQVQGFMVQKTVVVPQLQFEGHQHPCSGAEADSHGLNCSADHRNSPVARGRGGRSPFAQVVQVIVIPAETLRLISIMVLLTIEIPHLLVDKVVDAPFMQALQAVVIPVFT